MSSSEGRSNRNGSPRLARNRLRPDALQSIYWLPVHSRLHTIGVAKAVAQTAYNDFTLSGNCFGASIAVGRGSAALNGRTIPPEAVPMRGRLPEESRGTKDRATVSAAQTPLPD